MRVGILLLCALSILGCNKKPNLLETALKDAGKNKIELEKVIDHYKKSGEEKKLKAAYYLIENLPDQYHYKGDGVDKCQKVFGKMESIILTRHDIDYITVWDSLQHELDSTSLLKIQKVRDIEVIKGDYLIKNIDEAFVAWNYPWAKDMSFADFCQYILPYKMKNEEPCEWRSYFKQKYKWLKDSLSKNYDAFDACVWINEDLKKWFYFSKLNVPFDLSCNDLLKIRSGKCPQEVQMAAYAMRALGIPVTMEGVPYWANRSSRHDWNALIYKGKTIPFLGSEVNPGVYKVEFAYPGSLYSKRAKVFRTTYETKTDSPVATESEDIPKTFKNKRYKDVTAQYVPVSNVEIKVDVNKLTGDIPTLGYLCVFNNKQWKPVDWCRIENGVMQFRDIGSFNIAYLPIVYEDGELNAVAEPFILAKDGSVTYVKLDKSKTNTFTIDRKYPSGDDNLIAPGQRYELMYWDNDWRSLSKVTATEKKLTFENVPEGALLWLRNLDGGYQERIFTLDHDKIVWW